jgi:hypothetical protein
MFGCPESADHGWTSGYVNMTLNANSRNMFWNDDEPFSFEPYILGPYTQQTLQINFCIMKTNRTQLTNGTQEKHWPAGNYCIYENTRSNTHTPHTTNKNNVLLVNLLL